MKSLLALALTAALTPVAAARVWVSVYQHDGKTPLAAGTRAYLRDIVTSDWTGLELQSDHWSYKTGGHAAYPGDWFVVDYHAKQVGVCQVGLCDLLSDSDEPIQTLSFAHVPSRDFNHDTVVDFADFARFASQGRSTIGPDSSHTVAFDLNADGRVDLADLTSFSQRWLERIDSPIPPVPVKVFAEGWETAVAGVYVPGSTISSDAGSWIVGDSISQTGGCGLSPQKAEILAENGNHTLQLRSVESHSGCEDGVYVSLQEINGTNIKLNVPLTTDTVLSFKEVGELTDPQWHGSGQNCLVPPCFDNISLILGDNNFNYVAYVLRYLTWGIIYEFLRVATHPRVFHKPFSLNDAWAFLNAALASPVAGVLQETPRHEAVFKEVAAEVPDIVGNLVLMLIPRSL